MANPQDINSDLNLNAVPSAEEFKSTYGDVAEPVDIPKSDTAEFMFTSDEDEETSKESLFDQSLDDPQNPVQPALAEDRPVATSMIALATSDPSTLNPLTALTYEALDRARKLVDSQQEYAIRSKIANDRAVDSLIALDRYRKQAQGLVRNNKMDPRVVKGLDETYRQYLEQERKDDANTALEFEVAERIQDNLTSGDYVEARLIMNLHDNGNAEQRMYTEMAKNLIMSQRLEELQAKYKDSSWPRTIMNFITSLVPTKGNFDRAGILDDAGIATGAGGFGQFILSGDNLKEQSESLWALNLNDFAKAMAPNGKVMKAIEANAGLFMNDPGMELQLLKALDHLSETDQKWENIWGGVDFATVIPVAGATKLTKNLARLGARNAAVNQDVRAIMEATAKGADEAYRGTGVRVSDLEQDLTHSMFMDQRGVPLSSDIVASLRAANELRTTTIPEIMQSSRFTSPEELRAAFQAEEKAVREQYGEAIKDVRFIEENVQDGAVRSWEGDIAAQGQKVHRLEVTIGKKEGGGFASEGPAKGALTKYGVEGSAFRDESGQWFAKFETSVKEDGFVTSPLNTPKHHLLNYGRSTARISDPEAFGKAIVGGNAANRFNKVITKTVRQSLKGIPRKEKNALDQVIMKGQNKSKWFTRDEFAAEYERAHGVAPTPKVEDAYSIYRSLSDLSYLMRNDAMYQAKHASGMSSVKFQFGERNIDADGIINRSPDKRVTGGLFDVSAQRWLPKDVSTNTMKKMSNEGYVMVKLDHPFDLPDGTLVRNIMIKQGDFVSRPLRRTQLNYSMGGSRAYTSKYFAKQVAKDGEGNLINPNVFIAGANLNEMKIWTSKMNEAIDLARLGDRDATKFDEIFGGQKGYPSGEEFIHKVDTGRISIKDHIEVSYDREMPKAYTNVGDEGLKYVDLDETEIAGSLRTHGQMYYSRKGEALRDYTGDLAETVDPWETLNSSITQAASLTSMNGYKRNILERFKTTYGHNLELRNVDNTESLYELVDAKIAKGLPLALENKIKNEQQAIARILRFETGFDKSIRQHARATAEWILGNGRAGSLQDKLSNSVHWMVEKNPVAAARGMAFDAKLGVFNLGQLIVQSSTMVSATALSPRHGMKGMMVSSPLFGWAKNGYKDNFLDLMSKRGVWKMGGFSDEVEFKAFAKQMKESGILEVSGNNLSMIEKHGPNAIYGVASKVEAAREAGRFFFYSAEQMNRIVSSRIAWGELTEKGVKQGTSEFRESFVRLADDYSMNMMSESAAGFQHGAMSIPTQFWAYGFRMMDALLGSRFTGAQKARLLMANTLMAGSAGIPLGASLMSFYEEMTGKPTSLEHIDGWVDRGIIDGVVNAITGADVEIGARIGTTPMLDNIVKDLFGVGEYGEKSLGEILSGATGSIILSMGPTLWNAVKYSAAESGGDTPYVVAPEMWTALAREISTVNSAHNAWYAAMYQSYKTKGGATSVSDLPEADAFFMALGFQPGQVGDISRYMDPHGEDEFVKSGAKMITNWRQEAFNIPDKYEDNLKKVNAFMAMQPLHIRTRMLEQAKKIQDPSLYSSIVRKYEEEKILRGTYQAIENEQEQYQIEGNE